MRRLLILLALCLLCGCLTPSERALGSTPEAERTPGFEFTLADGSEAGKPPEQLPVPKTTPMTAEATKALLDRLPKLPQLAGDKTPFAKREDSKPLPKTGKTVEESFPPPPRDLPPVEVTSGPLEVVRFSPEGAVELAPFLSVTFNQPMVAVSSQSEASAVHPVKLTPEPPGEWRWVGSKTLLFKPKPRFPMATKYQVEIPSGTVSQAGQKLAAAKSFTFTTPAPRLLQKYPEVGPTVRDPLIFLGFDQAISPEKMSGHITLKADGKTFPFRLATAAARAEDTQITSLIDQAEEGRWLVIQPSQPLPLASTITVTVEAGAPSEEGPSTTPAPQSFTFSTYSPLKVVDQNCDPGDHCPPLSPWWVECNNPLDEKNFMPAMVTVSPEVPGFKVEAQGSYLRMRGRTKGNTTYTVTIHKRLGDSFGQFLGEPQELKFHVGRANKMLRSTTQGMTVLDPYAKPSFPIYTVNIKEVRVLAYALTPQDWLAFGKYYHGWRNEPPPPIPGRQVLNTTVQIKADPDELAETNLDLSQALPDKFGQLAVIVEDTDMPPKRYEQRRLVAWVQATNIGLDAMLDGQELVALTTDLRDGKPLQGVEVSISESTVKGQSGDNGLTTLDLPGERSKQTSMLLARQGKDLAILPEHAYFYESQGNWLKRTDTDSLLWYVVDDRQMYRPGEKVSVKGWIRRMAAGPKGDLEGPPTQAKEVSYTVFDSRNNKIGEGKAALAATGGFDFNFQLPATPNLGYARIQLDTSSGLGNSSTSHGFQIQEFRRPEFEVTSSPSDGPHLLGGQATVTVHANYYAGGGLPNAEVNWSVSSSPGSFSPPNHPEFTFGRWTPWWDMGPWWRTPENPYNSKSLSSHTDSSGAHTLELKFQSVWPPQPMSVSAQASVEDVNRQSWATSSSLLVHPAKVYVGLKSPRTFVQQGEKFELETIVADLDGRLQTGTPILLELVRLEWAYEKGEYIQKELDLQTQTITSAAQPQSFSFKPGEGGSYRLTATVKDADGRLNQSTLSLWVAGGKVPTSRSVEQERITMIPDRKQYAPGDTAEILIQAPFADAEGVVSLRRNGLLKKEPIVLKGTSYTLKVPIEEFHTPNLYVQVDLVGAAQRTGPDGKPLDTDIKRPAYATGMLNLSVPPLARKLTVEVAPAVKALSPGGETQLQLTVKDAAGKPAQNCEAAVVVVDESVLALTGYRLPDPLNTFYPGRGAGVSDYHSRGYVALASADLLENANEGVAPGMAVDLEGGEADELYADAAVAGRAMSAEERPAPSAAPRPEAKQALRRDKTSNSAQPAPDEPIAMRTNFDALALFAAEVPTNAQGQATVKIKVPDNLTRYRIMAVAVAGNREFGQGESTLTARLPLMVRQSPPRFLNFGDHCELPVVLQNQTDAPMEVQVAMRATNAKLDDALGRQVVVPANNRVEVRFPVAADQAGKARFQVGAQSQSGSDASQFELPVWTPATSEAFATYGEIDQGAIAQPVKMPGEVWPQFGGLEVTTSSTAVGALTDAVLYLVAYPFECSEQVASRVMSIAALRDVLSAFKAEGLPPEKELLAAVGRDIEKLKNMQNYDGGWDYWIRGRESDPYLSIHVGHALIRAKQKKFAVPEDALERNRQFLVDIQSHIPYYYSQEAKWALRAYALYVRNLAGDNDPATARALLAEVGPIDKVGLETLGWLLPVLSKDPASAAQVKAIRLHFNNRVSETAATAQFATSYGDSNYLLLYSDRRVDAVLLEALILDSPKSDIIPKIVRGLLDHRSQGHWGNTQENCWVLLALDRYFNTYEKVEPDFVARVWLGQQYAGEHAFKGRTTEESLIKVPMKLLSEKAQNLVLQKDGKGRLYYRIGMRYAPKSLKLEPADYGFVVERRYEAVDDNRDVTRDADGVWHVKAGAKVRVRLTMVAPERRYHVALVDPLPAGLEAMNPALAVTGEVPREPNASPYWWWGGTWYEHQNLRDERTEAFSSLVWPGVYEYNYVARATTPGNFVVPPTKAEEMYHPETFGRCGTDRLVVD